MFGLLNSYLGYILLLCTIGITYIYFKGTLHQGLKKCIGLLLIIGFSWLIGMQCLVLSEFWSSVPESKDVEYVVVLGAGLHGDKVSYTLAYRLDAAIEYSIKNPEVTIIVSGGQGPDEDISEAEAMKKYLVIAGVKESQIILEDQSTSTEENIKFSKALMTENPSVAIVSSNYHMYRAKFIGSQYIRDIEGIATHAPYWSVINYMLRESVTILNEWRKDVF